MSWIQHCANTPTVETYKEKVVIYLCIKMSKKESLAGGEWVSGKAAAGWAEPTSDAGLVRVEAREMIIPRARADSEEDIPTLPDLDDLQEALDKEIARAPVVQEEVVGGGSVMYAELEAAEARVGEVDLSALLAHVRSPGPHPEPDAVWTVASLLTDLQQT